MKLIGFVLSKYSFLVDSGPILILSLFVKTCIHPHDASTTAFVSHQKYDQIFVLQLTRIEKIYSQNSILSNDENKENAKHNDDEDDEVISRPKKKVAKAKQKPAQPKEKAGGKASRRKT